MTITIESFDGFDLNNSTYTASFPYEAGAMDRAVTPVVLDVIGGFPRTEGTDPQPITFQIRVIIAGTMTTEMDSLKQYLAPGTEGDLVVTFDATTRVRDCTVVGVYPFAGSRNQMMISLIAADPRWRSASTTATANNFTASAQTMNVTNAGNAIEDKPIIVLKPTTNKAAANSWKYRRYAVVTNRVKRALTDWPIDITNGGIDHAALVTAVKSQADGDDVRVLQDGVEIPRYFGEHANNDANSTLTKVWATPKFSAMREAHLLATITDSVPANGGDLEVQRSEARFWPKSGYLLNPTSNEVFSYTGWTEKNASGNAAFTGINRARMGTAAAAGTAADQLLRVEHKLELIYGHTGIAAPEARPSLKPLLDLTSSTLTNIRHEWINWWDDTYPTRPAQWARKFEARDVQSAYMHSNRGSPATTADFLYNYYNPPTDRDVFNVMRRAIPVGTSGAAGQIVFNRVVDSSLLVKILGVMDDGVEHLLGTLQGPLTSANFTSAFVQKCYEVGLYARSAVVMSTPQMDGSPLAEQLNSATYYSQVNALNTAGNLYGIFKNESGNDLNVYGVEVLAWQPTTPHTDIVVSAWADNAGVPSGNTLGVVTIAAASLSSFPEWLSVAFARPFPWIADQIIHLNVQSGSGSSSNTLWAKQPMTHVEFPMRAARFKAEQDMATYARAEGGGGTGLYAPTSADNVTIDTAYVLLDSTGVPDFMLSAEADCYWLNGTLVNQTTSQELAFGLYVTTNDEIEVDVGARTVTNLTTGEGGLLYGVTPTDADAWFSLVDGINVIRLDETGLAAMTVTFTHYDRWE